MKIEALWFIILYC